MAFKKIGELIGISPDNIKSVENMTPIIDAQMLDNMKKFATDLKKIAPKAEDFLYFSAVMMHAAEAALINDDGTPKLTRSGEKVSAHWNTDNGTWRWICNDSSIRPNRNSNGDIFPEKELLAAYKKWIGKPLCIDHKSSSVDHVRGFIVDTYYDHNLHRVIALCALDKVNYPDLARKVSTGYSNSVSMGTGVSQAICFDCGTVARTEHDFCHHMKTKSSYGEINIGLNPIELSIVVNGADPSAKIKHIIAAANTLNCYVEEKQQQLKKISDKKYTAIISTEDDSRKDNGDATRSEVFLESTSLEDLKSDVEKAFEELSKINSSLNSNDSEKNMHDLASNYGPSNSTVAMDETDLPGTDFSLAPPHSRFATENEELSKFASNTLVLIESKLEKMQQELNKLASNLNNGTKEEIMSGQKEKMQKEGYFQGGGGVNEPTPGDKKYPVDPTQDDLRENGDKQMVGQKPFPDVGPVDGIYPGYESFPSQELERKKMLARAESEERALRRNAVITKAQEAVQAAKKQAYFNNGQDAKNPNTPTPHQRKYPVDPTQDDLRESGDKQMVGQKPFPNVGPVDGLHPSPESADVKDELKRKEMLRRAALTARFVKAAKNDGSPDFGKSTWQVIKDGKVVFSKTIDEITGGRSETLYEITSSESFGQDLMKKIRAHGAEKVSALFKSAQVPPPAPQGDAMETPAMPAASEDVGAEGDPKATALELSEKVRDLASDLVEVVRELSGEEAEMGNMNEMDLAGADDSKVSTAHLMNMKKQIITPLISSAKEALANLNDHEAELNSIVSLYEKGAVNDKNSDFIASVAQSAIVEAKEALANSFNLLGSYAQFAYGSDAIEKRALQEAILNKKANGENMANPENKEIMSLLSDSNNDFDTSKDSTTEQSFDNDDETDMLNAFLADDLANVEDSSYDHDDTSEECMTSDSNDAVTVSDPSAAVQIAKDNPSLDVEVKKAALETKAGRQALRAKLAAEMKWNPIFREFHPKDKALPGPLDTKPSDNLEVVENLAETHDVMMDVATAPPNVRKVAAEINALVKSGQLNANDVDLLLANGIDPAAVKYYKDFYGEMGPEGKEFAAELVKEHAKAQVEEENNVYRVKLARAHELAYEMADRELIPRSRESISNQVNTIMNWNDAGFESVKAMVSRHASAFQKQASFRMPQVGLYGSEESNTNNQGPVNDYDLLVQAFSTSKTKRMF